MTPRATRPFLLAVLMLSAPPMLRAQTPPSAITASVTGTVINAATKAPVRIAAVRALTGTASTLSNDAGRYRIELPLGEQRLEVRRIGYRPSAITVLVVAGGATADVKLDPIAVGLDRMVVTAQDDAARRIIAAAIRRKQRTRGSVHDYRYDGDVRFVVRDLRKSADSASSVVAVTQTRTSAYWEQPDRYQETIVARRQTGNVAAEQNLVGVGQIVNFGRDRVTIGRFELASPVADDALSRYDYHILDTLALAGRRVFRLSLEPKPDGTPAFSGVIDIADSTFDVTGIDVGVNSAVRLGPAQNVRYQQHFGETGGRWMPRSIDLSFEVRLPIGNIQYRFEQTAQLSEFRFNEGRRPAGLGEYRIVVADSADRADSAIWASARAIPLTPVEQAAFVRIDSIKNAPRSIPARLAGGVFQVLVLANNPDFFHYNRVDGAWFGAGWTWRNLSSMPATEPSFRAGYAEAARRGSYRVGDRVRLSEARRAWVGASFHDETVSRPTLTSPGYNPTLRALVSVIDPLDYYRERGLEATATTKVVDFVRLDATYTDARQTSLPVVLTTPIFRRRDGRAMPPNESITDGYLRSLSATLAYDSRQLLRQAGRDQLLGAARFTRIALAAEMAPGRSVGSDFDYRRVSARIDRRQQSFGLGVTSVLLTGGAGSAGMPPQRFFGVDGGAQVLETQASPFNTLVDSSFSAQRAAVVSVQHDFDRLLFTRSGLPLIRDIPFTFTVRGSVFWTGGPAPAPGRLVIGAPYREAGFSVGNLTPFAAPFNLSARFAWQISKYPTTPFRFSIGFGS